MKYLLNVTVLCCPNGLGVFPDKQGHRNDLMNITRHPRYLEVGN